MNEFTTGSSTVAWVNEARAALADQPFAALQTEISQRIVFADSVAAGRLACEAAPKCAAAREIAALTQAVQEMLG